MSATSSQRENGDNIWPADKEGTNEPRGFRDNLIYLKVYDLLITEEELLPLIRKKLKEKVKLYKELISKKIQEQRDFPNERETLDEERAALVMYQKRAQHKLNFLDGKVDFQTNYFDNKLIRAREVPVSNFVKFNHAGFAPCLWHSEKTGSMKYYEKDNKVHCFGCHAGGDVLDVVGAIYKLDFKQSLAFILNEQ